MVTDVLELIGMLVMVTGLSAFWSTVAPDAWAWPVALIVWGMGAVGVSWILGHLDESEGP